MYRPNMRQRSTAFATIVATLLMTTFAGACSRPDFEGPSWDDESGYALYEEGDVYLVVATTIKPGDGRAFRSQAEELAEQLRTQEGLVLFGYSGSVAEGTAQTLSVWRDAASLAVFMVSEGHVSAVAAHSGNSEDFATDIWEIDGSDLPPTWDEADVRLAAVLAE